MNDLKIRAQKYRFINVKHQCRKIEVYNIDVL